MEKYLTIGEMSRIHNISRQTLIYYDKIGLFKPAYTNDKGYRYYSPDQIPLLREICFLKSLGINLGEIHDHMNNRNLSTAILLLQYHEKLIGDEIAKLTEIKHAIENRLRIYKDANQSENQLDKPAVKYFPEREVAFLPFRNKICRRELHLTIMKILSGHSSLLANGFGTILKKEQLGKEDLFVGAGSYILLSSQESGIQNNLTLPGGEYACMYKYGMPYDTRFLVKLLNWIKSNGYIVCGDVVDACLLDTTFYSDQRSSDFCELQIPVTK